MDDCSRAICVLLLSELQVGALRTSSNLPFDDDMAADHTYLAALNSNLDSNEALSHIHFQTIRLYLEAVRQPQVVQGMTSNGAENFLFPHALGVPRSFLLFHLWQEQQEFPSGRWAALYCNGLTAIHISDHLWYTCPAWQAHVSMTFTAGNYLIPKEQGYVPQICQNLLLRHTRRIGLAKVLPQQNGCGLPGTRCSRPPWFLQQ